LISTEGDHAPFPYCHDSHFDLDGGVVSGPAESPLAAYETEYEAAADEVRVRIEA